MSRQLLESVRHFDFSSARSGPRNGVQGFFLPIPTGFGMLQHLKCVVIDSYSAKARVTLLMNWWRLLMNRLLGVYRLLSTRFFRPISGRFFSRFFGELGERRWPPSLPPSLPPPASILSPSHSPSFFHPLQNIDYTSNHRSFRGQFPLLPGLLPCLPLPPPSTSFHIQMISPVSSTRKDSHGILSVSSGFFFSIIASQRLVNSIKLFSRFIYDPIGWMRGGGRGGAVGEDFLEFSSAPVVVSQVQDSWRISCLRDVGAFCSIYHHYFISLVLLLLLLLCFYVRRRPLIAQFEIPALPTLSSHFHQ